MEHFVFTYYTAVGLVLIGTYFAVKEVRYYRKMGTFYVHEVGAILLAFIAAVQIVLMKLGVINR